jgi:hypothetical protein
MIHRTPKQVAEARTRLQASIRPGAALPPGMTIFDAVAGKWPGDESDEQVAAALKDLS